MLYKICNRFTGGVIFSIETESMKLCAEAAVKSGANLFSANLSRADLSRADLSGANLSRADLFSANLSGADLSGAKGISPHRCTPLLMLLDQPGQIVAYKLANASNEGPYNGGIRYEIGGKYEVSDANTDTATQCGSGIHVATLDWCLREWQEGYKILKVQFTAEDIAAIPTATDGKFRLHRCEIVGEVDLKAIGIKCEVDNSGKS